MPLEHEINKKETELLLKQYEIINRVKYTENDKIVYIKYYLGNIKMNKQKTTLESLTNRVDVLTNRIDNLTTIVESLAIEMRAGFKSVNDRLDKVESRLDRVESRLDKVESRLDNIDDRLAIIEREATKHGWDLNHDNN